MCVSPIATHSTVLTIQLGTDHETCWNQLNPGRVLPLLNSRSGFMLEWLLGALAISGFKPSLT